MRKNIQRAVELIKSGEVVGIPTETVYGLAANAFDESAVKKAFKMKGRPADNPLIVHVSSTEMLIRVVRSMPPVARNLIRKYWPGPLTIIFPKHPDIPYCVTAGLETVAVRMPSNNIALALIESSGVPIAAPSANISGKPSPTRAEHVQKDFPELFVLDGGPCKHGVESTVVDVESRPTILRLGAVTMEQLEQDIPNIVLAEQHSDRPSSPGMKYKHYAPETPLVLFPFNKKEKMQEYLVGKEKHVVLCLEEHIGSFTSCPVISLGKTSEDAALNIYHTLRVAYGDEIVVLGLEKKGAGRTVMDRLERAATTHI